jgi:SAM-dependent methyltransferase
MSAVISPELETTAAAKPQGDALGLFLVSVAGLFLELMLIRWIGSELPIFGFLQNAVLVVCFLGMGMGCWTCRQPVAIRDVLVPLGVLVLFLAVFVTLMDLGRFSPILSYVAWPTLGDNPGATIAAMGLEAVLVILALLVCWMLFVLLDDHPNTIRAYSVNIAASLAGIWLFVLLSVLYQPPGTWLVVAAVLLGGIGWRITSLGKFDAVILAGIVALGWVASFPPRAMEIYWSPYQKLTLELPQGEGWGDIGDYIIRVNNSPYQGMLDLRPETVAQRSKQDPKKYPPELAGLSQYDIPLLLQAKPERVLIVGAGSGNDAAGARRGGAKHITAVDIDQAIITMGTMHHPEHPYGRDDGVVQVVNDDARSFFATSNEKFDLIIFGLLDAPLQSGNANIHLDNYVYTREALQRARSLLAPNGVLVLTFERLREFIPRRMFAALTEVFGHEPEYFYIPQSGFGWGGVMFVVAENQEQVKKQIASNSKLAGLVDGWKKEFVIAPAGDISIINDDWPYLYLQKPMIPLPYYGLAAFLGLLFVFGVRRLGVPEMAQDRDPTHWHFFFLGAAFMLLEVQNISKAAVVLGNTWWVNAVIISSILVLILFANLIAAKLPRLPLQLIYGLLIGSCLVLFFVDISQFAFLPYATKAVVVGLWTSLPMLFSGIIFIRSFASVPAKDKALGANLFGSLCGGLLQSITFVIGIKALLLLVAGLYLAAFFTRPRAAQTGEAPAGEASPAVS